jgi:hypothetical protein
LPPPHLFYDRTELDALAIVAICRLRTHAYVAVGARDRKGLRVLDVTDPTRPAEVARAGDWTGWAVAVRGGYAFVAASGGGLRVLDVADPAQPVEVAAFQTPTQARAVAVDGDLVYVAAEGSGLWAFRFSSARTPLG